MYEYCWWVRIHMAWRVSGTRTSTFVQTIPAAPCYPQDGCAARPEWGMVMGSREVVEVEMMIDKGGRSTTRRRRRKRWRDEARWTMSDDLGLRVWLVG